MSPFKRIVVRRNCTCRRHLLRRRGTASLFAPSNLTGEAALSFYHRFQRADFGQNHLEIKRTNRHVRTLEAMRTQARFHCFGASQSDRSNTRSNLAIYRDAFSEAGAMPKQYCMPSKVLMYTRP